jgi:hypothetical protein
VLSSAHFSADFGSKRPINEQAARLIDTVRSSARGVAHACADRMGIMRMVGDLTAVVGRRYIWNQSATTEAVQSLNGTSSPPSVEPFFEARKQLGFDSVGGKHQVPKVSRGA